MSRLPALSWPGLALIAAALLPGCTEDNPQTPVDASPDAASIGDATVGDATPRDAAPDAQTPPDADVIDGAVDDAEPSDSAIDACIAGAEGCACDDDTCDDGLVCTDDVCVDEACTPGTEECPCDAEDVCDDGLLCVADVCVPVQACPPGTADCPCDGGACRDALSCVADVCRACALDVAGCPCDLGACEGGLLCDDDACRAPIECDAAGCQPFQLCAPAVPGTDARCLEDCEPGHVWNDAAGTCLPAAATCAVGAPNSIADACAADNRACIEADGNNNAQCGECLAGFVDDGDQCVLNAQANCADDPADADSILANCTAQNRGCVADAAGASCGACLETFIEDPSSANCVAADAFGECDGLDDCVDGLFCSARAPQDDPRCLPPACPAGETLNLRTGECTNICACEGIGQTGQPWPVTDFNGDCVCETEPGFFFNTSAGARRAEPCDADGDGWTRRSAFVHIESVDEAVRLNARCDLRTIDRIVLVNEFNQTQEITIQTLSGGLSQSEPLYEIDESDAEAEALERQSTAYGARKFHAAELNPLTKACVSDLDDFNGNGISDLREHQRALPAPQNAWMATFVAASYFVELHTGHFEPPAEGALHGRYVIAERSRCDASFALGYDASAGAYAASCTRRRDGGYTNIEPVGYDFMGFNCADPDGACPPLLPPVPAGSFESVQPHGLCEERVGEDPESWRGMNHASQFKCVQIIASAEPRVEPFQRRRDTLRLDVQSDAPNTLNTCSLTRCDADDAECVEFDAAQAGANPAQPALTCQSDVAAIEDREALLGRVSLVAVRYQDYDALNGYAGGCINEQTEWPQLCPGFDPDFPGGTIGSGSAGNFGKIICGCGFNYGGADCDVGCPDEQLHFGGVRDDAGCENGYCVTAPNADGSDGGRDGFWMCGDFAATSYTENLPEVGAALVGEGVLQVGEEALQGTFTIRGQLPIFGTDSAPLCESLNEDGSCGDAGFTIR